MGKLIQIESKIFLELKDSLNKKRFKPSDMTLMIFEFIEEHEQVFIESISTNKMIKKYTKSLEENVKNFIIDNHHQLLHIDYRIFREFVVFLHYQRCGGNLETSRLAVYFDIEQA